MPDLCPLPPAGLLELEVSLPRHMTELCVGPPFRGPAHKPGQLARQQAKLGRTLEHVHCQLQRQRTAGREGGGGG